MELKKWIKESRFAMGLLMVQLITTGLQILSRIILNQGSFVFAYMAYRHLVGAFCVGPFAMFFERSRGCKLSWWAFFWLFIISLTGVSMGMGFFYYGLRDTTATYATNFLNLVPIVTCLFSVIFGMERLQLGSSGGKIKGVGAMLCLGGGLIIALYKGKMLHIISHPIIRHPSVTMLKKAPKHWTRGTLFLLFSCFCFGIWYISQVKLLRIYPYKVWATFYICIIAAIQLVVTGLCIDRSKAAWRLSLDLQLITIFYSGAMATGVSFCLVSWAVAERGAAYTSMFSPLSMIFVAISEALLLGEEITVGSLSGMTLVMIGLYLFIWGKNKETTQTKKTLAGNEAVVPIPNGQYIKRFSFSLQTTLDILGYVSNVFAEF